MFRFSYFDCDFFRDASTILQAFESNVVSFVVFISQEHNFIRIQTLDFENSFPDSKAHFLANALHSLSLYTLASIKINDFIGSIQIIHQIQHFVGYLLRQLKLRCVRLWSNEITELKTESLVIA